MVTHKHLKAIFFGVIITLISLGTSNIVFGLQQVPDILKPNPVGLVRPPHLGSEWPHLNPDEKLYSLKFDLLRAHYQKWSQIHIREEVPPLPTLKDQFEIMNFQVIPPDYYGEEVIEDYHQSFEDLSPSLSGATGLIDIASAYTQKKGVKLASLVLTTIRGSRPYMEELYGDFSATDITGMFTYGVHDNFELTFSAGNLSREIDYVSGLTIDDSKLMLGAGGKVGFGTWADHFQVAGGFHFSVFDNTDRDVILDTDYETLSNFYATISTDSKYANAHVMWKYVNYHHSSSAEPPLTGHIPGAGPDSGHAPSKAHWGQLGFGFEFKVPEHKLRVITELIKNEIAWGSESKKSFNIALQKELNKMDMKFYGRKLNQASRNEFGLISTYHF